VYGGLVDVYLHTVGELMRPTFIGDELLTICVAIRMQNWREEAESLELEKEFRSQNEPVNMNRWTLP
jgi:hypothetical protein